MSRKFSRIALIAAATCAFALPLALLGCGNSSAAAPSEDKPAQESKADDTQTSDESSNKDEASTN